MLGQLKDRILSFQEEISSSVKQFAPSDQYSGTQPTRCQLDAGSELLETWQNHWEELHLINERNAKTAAKCDQKITHLKKRTQKQLNGVVAIQNHIPKINYGIKEIMNQLGTLESLIGDVEIALLALEDTIDAREMQEKQLDQRFQLAMYQERRKAEFNELANHLQAEHDRKKKIRQNKNDEQRKHKQEQLQKRFEADLDKYKEGLLQVPNRHDPDASLESVDLDDPPEDLNATDALEAFLNQPDVLYDLSPLPKDETPLKKEDIVAEIPPINVLNAETPTPTGSGILSREDSTMYFTPDATTDKLSEVSLD